MSCGAQCGRLLKRREVVVLHLLPHVDATYASESSVIRAIPNDAVSCKNLHLIERNSRCMLSFSRIHKCSRSRAQENPCVEEGKRCEERYMHIAANEVQPVNAISKLFLDPLRIEQATTVLAFDVHICYADGSATEEFVTE